MIKSIKESILDGDTVDINLEEIMKLIQREDCPAPEGSHVEGAYVLGIATNNIILKYIDFRKAQEKGQETIVKEAGDKIIEMIEQELPEAKSIRSNTLGKLTFRITKDWNVEVSSLEVGLVTQ